MSTLILKKHPVVRALHYLFLLPFLFALRPVIINNKLSYTLVYLSGVFLMIFLIIYSNKHPLLEALSKEIRLHLHYRHEVEIHPYTDLIAYERISSRRLALHSRNYHPVVLFLTIKNIDRLVTRLEEEELHAISS